MPRVCTVCTHLERENIDAALLSGESYRHIAARFDTSTSSLQRHKDHIPQHLAKATDAAEVVQADGLLDRLQSLNTETMQILREARSSRHPDNELALKAISRAEKQLELQARLLGELNEGTTVNVLVNPEWLALRAVIVRAVAPYPEAAQAVERALDESA